MHDMQTSNETAKIPATQKFFGWASVVLLLVLVGLMWHDKNEQIAGLNRRLDIAENSLHVATWSDAMHSAEKEDLRSMTVLGEVTLPLPGSPTIVMMQSSGLGGYIGPVFAVWRNTLPADISGRTTPALVGTRCYFNAGEVCYTPAQLESVW